jgi:hypothetical protein
MNNNIPIKRRKGQAAIEFLVTYGWAIMAAMLVIGALTYFGITNPATSLPDKCIFSNAFECKDYIIKSSSVQIKATNTGGQTIYGTGGTNTINASLTETNVQCTVAGTPSSLEPEAELDITCNNPPGSPFNVNEKGKAKITISYAKNPSGYVQLSLGEMYATVQT